MCLIALAWQCHPRYSLALVANRDEFHDRPADPAQRHADAPDVFGGRDLEKGGSWLLASARGRFAAVTNVRDGRHPESAPRSRGELVSAYARAAHSPGQFMAELAAVSSDFGRFNLLTAAGGELHYAGNFPQFHSRALAPGMHAVSNGPLDAPWPKARRVQSALVDWLHTEARDREDPDTTSLFSALADTRPAGDAELPDTGIGRDRERWLSSPFIVGEDYGTRASTVLLVERGRAQLIERSFGPQGRPMGESRLQFDWP